MVPPLVTEPRAKTVTSSPCAFWSVTPGSTKTALPLNVAPPMFNVYAGSSAARADGNRSRSRAPIKEPDPTSAPVPATDPDPAPKATVSTSYVPSTRWPDGPAKRSTPDPVMPPGAE